MDHLGERVVAALGPAAAGELLEVLERSDADRAALAELRRILEAPGPYRTAVLRALTARRASADLATLIAMVDTDEVVRLRLLRAIRDLGA